MYLLTNKSRRTIKLGDQEIDRSKSIKVANDKWDTMRTDNEVRDLLIYGKLTAERVKK